MIGANLGRLFNPVVRTNLNGSSTPTTSILDNFNRANSTTTLGTNWTQFTPTFGSINNQGIINNTAYNPGAAFANYTGMMWNPTTFGPNCEAFMTIATLPTMNSGDDGPAMDVRINNAGNYNSYSFGINGGNGSGIKAQINIAVNHVETTLVSIAPVAVSSGDKMWFTAIGNLLTGYIFHNGAWVQILQTTDATYAGVVGNIGFYIPGNNTDGRIDDYGGGSLS